MQAQGFRIDGAISVYKADDGVLELLDGQRRLSAVLAIREGDNTKFPRIPALLVPYMASPVDRLLYALGANDHGLALSPLEEGRAFVLLQGFGLTTDEIATRRGKTAGYVRGRLTLLEATPTVAEALTNGAIGIGEAVQIVKHAERDGTSQAVQLAQRQAAKVARVASRPTGKRTTEETIIAKLARLEDDYGPELVERVARQRYSLGAREEISA
jgi:ParB-like chromosome segregation protein Spo0J